MKKLILGLLLLAVLVGCSTEGKIKVTNRTRNNLFLSVKGSYYTIPGATEEMINDDKGISKTVSFDTGKKFLMFAPDETEVDIYLVGETFLMNSGDTLTTVEVEPNETYRVYADPTHACVKVVNNSGLDITKLTSTQIFSLTNPGANDTRILTNNIPNGTEYYKQLVYVTDNASTDDRFFYQFEVTFADSTHETFGDYGELASYLELDDIFEIDLN